MDMNKSVNDFNKNEVDIRDMNKLAKSLHKIFTSAKSIEKNGGYIRLCLLILLALVLLSIFMTLHILYTLSKSLFAKVYRLISSINIINPIVTGINEIKEIKDSINVEEEEEEEHLEKVDNN
jgi:sensor histidine kinase YesM